MKFYLWAFLLTTAVFITAQEPPAVEDYGNDYDSVYDYDQLREEGEKMEAELDRLEAESDLKVETEIKKYREEDLYADVDEKDPLDGIGDYLYEDNRDKPKDDDRKDIPADGDGSFQAVDNMDEPLDNVAEHKNDPDDYALLWGDDSVAPLPVPDAEPVLDYKDILDETQNILDKEADEFEEEIKKTIEDPTDLSENKLDEEIINETKNILKETDDSFDVDEDVKTKDEIEKVLDQISHSINENNSMVENNKQVSHDESVVENELQRLIPSEVTSEKSNKYNELSPYDLNENTNDTKNVNSSIVEHKVIVEEDTVDKVYADLNADLDKLFDTLDKLSDDGSENDKKIEEVFDKLDEHLFKEDDNFEDSEELVEDVEDNVDYEDVDFNKILEDIKNEDDLKVDESAHIDLKSLKNDELNEPNPDDAFEKDVEVIPKIAEPILFQDAIEDSPKTAKQENDASIEGNQDKVNEFKTVDIDILNSEELEGLVKQFSKAHSEVLDPSSNFNEDAAEHIKLSVDDAVVVTSPNYPSPYPTNSIKDWVFDGEGMGIELNITDFLVNGALGDYLLVKPGGVDDSGHEGLLFTYRLTSEKRFRFTDVDRLFVRFQSQPGMMFMRGFSLSVKMIAPIPDEPEPLPAPEPVLEPPHSRHTLHLAVSLPEFNATKGAFRLLLADMAEEYITENSIEPGLNTTAQVTQITLVTTCPVTWPNYQLCTAVTFGISLNYEEGDDRMLDEAALKDMWDTYSTRDPYALRLSRMGISEFEKPNSGVMTAWLVIASGVVVAMAMLAFVMWRFSCFEDYTRMKSYNDTDSLPEKRGLDLYPTPHQTLPPLFSESEYKWPEGEDTTRVDMGGLANKSYARDMYDFESDEDVIPQRDRNGALTARDSYIQRASNA